MYTKKLSDAAMNAQKYIDELNASKTTDFYEYEKGLEDVIRKTEKRYCKCRK